jgi:hypothetical protein
MIQLGMTHPTCNCIAYTRLLPLNDAHTCCLSLEEIPVGACLAETGSTSASSGQSFLILLALSALSFLFSSSSLPHHMEIEEENTS